MSGGEGAGVTGLGHVVLVGAGNMGGAMLRRWPGDARITIIDPAPSDAISTHIAERGATRAGSAERVEPADLLVVAVKPQLMDSVLPTLRPLVSDRTVVISIAAGTTTTTLARSLGTERIVRTIPNTPATIGKGVTAAFAPPTLGDADRARATGLLECSGPVVWVADEDGIDRATAISGSGPAYVFHMVEALARAGEAIGLEPEAAMVLARQTVVGAGALLDASDEPAATLRENVTSKGGTTAEALGVLMDEAGLSALMERAARAAHERAKELGRGE